MTAKNSYSFSALSAAYNCQQLYKFRYIDKIIPKQDQTGDLAFGSAIHFALEQYYTEKSDPVESFKLYWEAMLSKDLQYGRYNHVALAAMGETLLVRYVRLHADKLGARYVEKRLFTTIEGHKLEGTPDVIGDFEGELSVIDFKTSGYRYPKDKILISEQMTLYAAMATKEYKLPITQVVYIVFIKGTVPSIQILKNPLTQDTVAEVVTNVVQQINDLESKIKDNRPYTRNTNNCIKGPIMCPYFETCWRK